MKISDVLEPNVDKLYAEADQRLTITLEQRIALSTAMSLKRIADALDRITSRPR